VTAANDGGNGSRSRGPFGALEMLDDVQRQAFDAAMRVASELSALTGELTGASWFGDPTDSRDPRDSSDSSDAGAADAAPGARRPLDVGRLRTDVARAAETFSDLMRALLDVGFDAMDELARQPAPRPAGSNVRGGVAHVRITVRNPHRDPVTRVRPHVAQLASDLGVVLDATVTVRPELLDFQPHESAAIEIDVVLPPAAEPGRYHGLLLLAGLPDVACAISVDVAADAARGADEGSDDGG
jgi:hypothetical protein